MYEAEEDDGLTVDFTIVRNDVIEEKNPDDELMEHYNSNLDEEDDDS